MRYDRRDFAEFEQVLADRLKFTPGPDTLLFIDESQESRQLGRFVRFMKEDWRDATVILSGSTLSRLFRNDVRYPVGRVQQLVVSPFSFSEYLEAMGESPLAAFMRGDELPVTATRHERLLELFDDFLVTGGLPAAVLVNATGHDHREMLAQIDGDSRAWHRDLCTNQRGVCQTAGLASRAAFRSERPIPRLQPCLSTQAVSL